MKQNIIKTWILHGFVIISSIISPNLFAQNARTDRALPEFEAQYAIEFFGMKAAEANYTLKYTDTGYKFTQKTRLSGITRAFRSDTVDATSYIDKVDNQLLLQRYQYIQTGEEKNKNEDFSIKWDTSSQPEKGTISGIVRGKQINLKAEGPVWEALSFQVPLMLEASTKVKEYPYKAVLKGEIDTYNFVLTSTREMSFADKKYQALQMVRSDPNRNWQLHIWLLPELHNIPVLIENYRDGKVHSKMVLETVKFNKGKNLNRSTSSDDL